MGYFTMFLLNTLSLIHIFADAELAGTAGNGVQRVFQAVGMAGRAVPFHFRPFHLLLGFPEILHPLHAFPTRRSADLSQRGRLHAPGGGDVEAAAGLQLSLIHI